MEFPRAIPRVETRVSHINKPCFEHTVQCDFFNKTFYNTTELCFESKMGTEYVFIDTHFKMCWSVCCILPGKHNVELHSIKLLLYIFNFLYTRMLVNPFLYTLGIKCIEILLLSFWFISCLHLLMSIEYRRGVTHVRQEPKCPNGGTFSHDLRNAR